MIPTRDAQFVATNRLAIISVAAGSLSVLSLCVAVVPIPFTGYLCFPAATILAAMAVASGLISLFRIRSSGERGRTLAAGSIALGVLVLTAEICTGVVAIALWSRLAGLTPLLTR